LISFNTMPFNSAASNDPAFPPEDHWPEPLAAKAAAAKATSRQADNCILLAVVTSPEVSATLIDKAVELRRNRLMR
jgi:hypothetical protein